MIRQRFAPVKYVTRENFTLFNNLTPIARWRYDRKISASDRSELSLLHYRWYSDITWTLEILKLPAIILLTQSMHRLTAEQHPKLTIAGPFGTESTVQLPHK